MQILITGATGWMGRSILNSFANSDLCQNNNIIAFAKDETEIILQRQDKENIIIPEKKLSDIKKYGQDTGWNYIIHTAFLTQDKLKEISKKNFTEQNISIINTIKNFLTEFKSTKLFAFSSGTTKYKSISDSNPYRSLKIMEENMIKTFCKSYFILRVYGLSGFYMRDYDSFAFGDFVKCALLKKRINIRSHNNKIRGYVSAKDLAELSLSWIKSKDIRENKTIDAVTENISLIDLANKISQKYGLEKPKHSINFKLKEENYSASSYEFLKILETYGLKPTNIDNQIEETYQGLLERSKFSIKKN